MTRSSSSRSGTCCGSLLRSFRSFEAGSHGLDVICIGGRKPKGGDTERFEDFWN
jgi:hypothetical protein